jgi:hypothetical protein
MAQGADDFLMYDFDVTLTTDEAGKIRLKRIRTCRRSAAQLDGGRVSRRRVFAMEYLLVDVLQVSVWVDAQFVAQSTSRAVICAKRVCASAYGVKGAHQEPGRCLVEWMARR